MIRIVSDLKSLSTDQIEHWVAAALAEEKALRLHDQQLFPVETDPESLRVAYQLRDLWKRWASDAEELLKRALALCTRVIGAHDLEYLIARSQAMLKLTPEELQKRREQVDRGEVYTLEEIRRELRAEGSRVMQRQI